MRFRDPTRNGTDLSGNVRWPCNDGESALITTEAHLTFARKCQPVSARMQGAYDQFDHLPTSITSKMGPCADCKKLMKAPLTTEAPHGRLELTGKDVRSFQGQARGHVEFYRCRSCGIDWGRALDAKDAAASWYRR